MFKGFGFSMAFAAAALVAFAGPFDMAQASAADTSQSPQIVMYTTQTCGYCVKARAWLKERNLPWDERDIEASAEAQAQWKSHGGIGTPLILVNGKRFNGFSPDALEAELAKFR